MQIQRELEQRELVSCRDHPIMIVEDFELINLFDRNQVKERKQSVSPKTETPSSLTAILCLNVEVPTRSSLFLCPPDLTRSHK